MHRPLKSPIMLLTIDIGNTNIKLGVWNGRSWLHFWRLSTSQKQTVDEYGIVLKALTREMDQAHKIEEIIIASVVPRLSTIFAEVCEVYLGETAVFVTHTLDTGITVATDDPPSVGTDRIANVAAVFHTKPMPSIVIDMGTATKFEILDKEGTFHGGVIAPGLQIIADALSSRAAKLSQVALEAPPHTIGRNTIHAVQSGLIFGYVALVEGILARLMIEHPNQDEAIQVVGTGGLIEHITDHTNRIDWVDPRLTLTGLRIIHERLQRAPSPREH